MESLLAEQPLVTSGLLAFVAIAMIFGWMQTGHRAALAMGALAILLIPTAFFLAASWVTDRERIMDAVKRTAQAVENNDFDTAIKIIAPQKRDKITAAKADLSRFRFEEARVNKFRTIDFVTGSFPPQAEIDMSVSAVVSDQRGQIRGMRVLRRVILQFEKSADGEWYVVDYNHLPIVGAPDGFSPQQ
jgi:hypothetical protein